jgi:hypothetical protein
MACSGVYYFIILKTYCPYFDNVGSVITLSILYMQRNLTDTLTNYLSNSFKNVGSYMTLAVRDWVKATCKTKEKILPGITKIYIKP